MSLEPVEEREARLEALQKALEVVTSATTDPEAAKKLSQGDLETGLDAFRRALKGEPLADV